MRILRAGRPVGRGRLRLIRDRFFALILLRRGWGRGVVALRRRPVAAAGVLARAGRAAAIGQAEQVTSVDMGKGALNWGRKNFELNAIDTEKHKFFCRDSFAFLEQCQAKNIKYDLIICDTPSFMKREKKLFKIKADLEGWIKTCLSCLNPQGELLISTNFDGFFIRDIEMLILKAQKSLQISQLEISSVLSSLDFELPDEKTSLKSFLIRLGN